MFIFYSYSCGSEVKRPNDRVVKCVRRDLYYPSEVVKIYLIVLEVVACLACWCRGKPFPSPKYCLTTLMTSKIPNITWDVEHSLNLYVGLQSPGWLYVLGIPPRADVRLWTPSRCHGPRPGPKRTCGIWAGSLRATEPRARGETRGRERKNAQGPKKPIYTYVQGFHSGRLLKWNPGGDTSWKRTRR